MCVNNFSSNFVWKQTKKMNIYIYKSIVYKFIDVLYSYYLIKFQKRNSNFQNKK